MRYRVLWHAFFFMLSFSRIGMGGEPLSAPTGTATAEHGVVDAKKAVQQKPAPFSVVPAVTSANSGTENSVEKKAVDTIEPLFVKPLTAIETGRNDSNPLWSPQGTLIAFERSIGDKKEILIARADGVVVQTIYHQLSETGTDTKFFFPGVYEEVSYNAGLSWAPAGDRGVFMSNGGEGNYDLYVKDISSKATATTITTRLTDYKEAKNGHAHWSPVADRILFVSGRTGKGDIYLLDLALRGLTRLTRGGNPYLYPQWSPDGEKIAMIHGNNENHDIYVIHDTARPVQTLKALTTSPTDELRPVWSPDGRKIAFYSNYNFAGDPKVWSLVVMASDGSDAAGEYGLAAKVVARDIIPDVERGPAWMPDSSRLVYVKNDKQGYNPIYVVDLKEKTNMLVKTETKMNHDIACASNGTIAFRAQVDQWDQIYVMKLK